MNREIKQCLIELSMLMKSHNNLNYSKSIDRAISRGDKGIKTFIISNHLWAGERSIAKRILTNDNVMNDHHGALKQLSDQLVHLGELQIKYNIANPKTREWIKAYKDWREDGELQGLLELEYYDPNDDVPQGLAMIYAVLYITPIFSFLFFPFAFVGEVVSFWVALLGILGGGFGPIYLVNWLARISPTFAVNLPSRGFVIGLVILYLFLLGIGIFLAVAPKSS